MKHGGKRKPLTREQVQQVKRLYHWGGTYREIQRDTGISGTSIAKILSGKYDHIVTGEY